MPITHLHCQWPPTPTAPVRPMPEACARPSESLEDAASYLDAAASRAPHADGPHPHKEPLARAVLRAPQSPWCMWVLV